MNGYDSIHGLRELPKNHPRRISLDYRVLQIQNKERKNRDREWLGSEEGLRKLQKEKYCGKYVYVANEGVAGYGDSIVKASSMARKNTGIDPAEMIQLLIPKSPYLSL